MKNRVNTVFIQVLSAFKKQMTTRFVAKNISETRNAFQIFGKALTYKEVILLLLYSALCYGRRKDRFLKPAFSFSESYEMKSIHSFDIVIVTRITLSVKSYGKFLWKKKRQKKIETGYPTSIAG